MSASGKFKCVLCDQIQWINLGLVDNEEPPHCPNDMNPMILKEVTS